MSNFKHDSAGFLLGELVKSGEDLGRAQKSQVAELRAIRAELKRLAVGIRAESAAAGGGKSTPAARSIARQSAKAAIDNLPQIYRGGRAASAHQDSGVATLTGEVKKPNKDIAAKQLSETPATIERNARIEAGHLAKAIQKEGDAKKKRGKDGKFAKGDGDEDAASGHGLLGRISSRLGGVAGSVSSEVDPTLAAANEIKQVVEPLGRGFGLLFGNGSKERKKERWYRRFFKLMTEDHKLALRGSKVVAPAKRGGGIGGMAGIIGALMPVGLIARLPMMLLRAIPMVVSRLFAPLAAAMLAWNVGQWLGEKISKWLSDSGIGPAIFDPIFRGFDAFVDAGKAGYTRITDGFGKLIDGLKSIPEKFGSFFSGIDSSLRSLPVVGEAYGKAVDKLNAIATEAKVGFSEGKSREAQQPPVSTSQAVGRLVGKAASRVSDFWNGGAKNDLVSAANTVGVDAGLLAGIAHFESGFNADAAPIAKDGSKNRVKQHDGRMALSSAHGYGQFTDATWMDSLNRWGGKHGVAGAGSLNKEQANALRGDKELQAIMLAELTKHNIAQGRQLGGQDDAANVYAMHNLGGGDASKFLKALSSNPNMTVAQALGVGGSNDAHARRVIDGNKSLYGDGSVTVAAAYGKMGAAIRGGDFFANDARTAQAMSSLSAISVGAPTSVALSKAPVVPPSAPYKLPPAAEPAQSMAQLSSSQDKPLSVSVTVPEKIGQNVSDRGIAHIVTGGTGLG